LFYQNSLFDHKVLFSLIIPGEGDIDFSAYFAALKDIAFDGMLGLYLYGMDYLEVFTHSLVHLRGCLS